MTGPDQDEDPGPGRVPPHNLDAERALLGAALLSRDATTVLCTEVRPADFYKPGHQHVATAIASLWAEDIVGDPITVAQRLRDLDLPASTADLVDLQADAPGTANASHYARIVHDHATLRRLIGASSKLTDLGYEGHDAHAAVVRAQELLTEVAGQNGQRTYSGFEVPDVNALLDAGLKPPEADLLTRTDGHRLLYAGKMHMVSAEPSVGKTWVATTAVVEVLDMGGAALYLDYEDAPSGIIGRLVSQGVSTDVIRERFRYAQVVSAFGPAERAELNALLASLNPDLVIIDGVAEALVRDGADENSAGDFVAWKERLPGPIARTGAAVVMLDHVKKDDAGRWGRGTGAKLGAIDGVAYTLKTVSSYSRRRAGSAKLTIAKDRNGGVGAIGETAGIMHIEPHADGARVVVRIEPDTGQLTAADTWKPTVLMTRVSEELARVGKPVQARTLKSLVHSEKPKLIEEAIARLEAEGFISRTKLGRAIAYEYVRPYPGDGKPAVGAPADHPAGTPDNVTALFPEGENDPNYF